MPHILPAVRYTVGKLVGKVTSTANHKTVRRCARVRVDARARRLVSSRERSCALRRAQAVVQVSRLFRHPLVDKDVKRRTKFWAHDEFDMCSVGDMVRLEACRPLSKKKAHIVAEIVRKEDGSPAPSPFPSR